MVRQSYTLLRYFVDEIFTLKMCLKRFWTSAPAPILLGAGALALTTSTFLACVWPMSRPDGIPTLGLERKQPYALPLFIWAYCIVWWFIQVRVTCSYLYPYRYLSI